MVFPSLSCISIPRKKQEETFILLLFFLTKLGTNVSAQICKNNDSNWILPHMLTVGFELDSWDCLSKKLKHQVPFLSCWFGIFSVMLLITDNDLSLCPYMPYTCWPGYCPCALKHPTVLCRCINVVPSPNWVTVFLKSTLGKFTCLLVFVMARHLWLHHEACSELLNWSPISHQDMKGPYGKPRNHLLQWLHNTLAHCRLLLFFDTGFVLTSFANCGV